MSFWGWLVGGAAAGALVKATEKPKCRTCHRSMTWEWSHIQPKYGPKQGGSYVCIGCPGNSNRRKDPDRVERPDCCFPLNYKVLTPTGLRDIGEIRVGDRVASADLRTASLFFERGDNIKEVRLDSTLFVRVNRINPSTDAKMLMTLHLSNGDSFVCTPSQRLLLVDKNWERAGKLTDGSKLSNGLVVVSIAEHNSQMVTWLTVDSSSHNYLAFSPGGTMVIAHGTDAE